LRYREAVALFPNGEGKSQEWSQDGYQDRQQEQDQEQKHNDDRWHQRVLSVPSCSFLSPFIPLRETKGCFFSQPAASNKVVLCRLHRPLFSNTD
jgi:hypothetical protein